MEDLIKRIEALQDISVKLESSSDERTQLMNKTSAFGNDYIDNIENEKGFYSHNPNTNIFEIKDNENSSIEDVLDIYKNDVTRSGISAATGNHLGYIPAGGIYISALADYLACISNEYAGLYKTSPGAYEIEASVLDWIKKVFNFPKSAVGNLASGGSIANLIGIIAARDNHKIKGELIEKSVVYVSSHAHHCLKKALGISGLSDIKINEIGLDDKYRLDISDLKQKILDDKKNGLNPFMVVGSAGTTDTGAIDPFEEIGKVAKEHNLWFHVDGAYGGFFILVDSLKEKFKGIEMADSLVVDPHKSLFIPYGVGAVLVKNKEDLYATNQYKPSYLQDVEEKETKVNPADISPELTKHFRGLRVWLPLKLLGIKPFKACLEEKVLLIEYARNKLIDLGYVVSTPLDLSILFFRFPVENINQTEYNQKLLDFILEDGTIFLSSSTIDGHFVIRIAILSFRTKLKQVNKCIDSIQKAQKQANKFFGVE